MILKGGQSSASQADKEQAALDSGNWITEAWRVTCLISSCGGIPNRWKKGARSGSIVAVDRMSGAGNYTLRVHCITWYLTLIPRICMRPSLNHLSESTSSPTSWHGCVTWRQATRLPPSRVSGEPKEPSVTNNSWLESRPRESHRMRRRTFERREETQASEDGCSTNVRRTERKRVWPSLIRRRDHSERGSINHECPAPRECCFSPVARSCRTS